MPRICRNFRYGQKVGIRLRSRCCKCLVGDSYQSFLSSDVVAEILAVVTMATCLCAVAIFHFVALQSKHTHNWSHATARLGTSTITNRHSEALIEVHDPSSPIDDEAQANTESATIAPDDLRGVAHRDEESGLLAGSFFPVYLEQRITAARRTLRPVSLVIFELDGLDKNDSGPSSDRAFYISAVGDVVMQTLRESDCAFRMDANTFAAVMDDTTESGAVWAAERVRGVLHTGALAGRVTVSAGVACYPSHALEPEELITCANKALRAARARGVDQVEIAAEQ